MLRKIEQYQLQKYCSKYGILVLTYDDGPGTRMTRQLLNIFDKENIKATFFFLGRRAVKYPDLVNQAKSDGHEIGYHGQDHLNYWKVLPTRASRDMRVGYQTLSTAMEGRGIFRPPYGKITLIQWLELKYKKIQIGWWTFVSGDTYGELQSIEEITCAIRANHGGVILLHDFDRDDDHIAYEKYVLELTRKLIYIAQQDKLKIMKFGDLLDKFHHT